MNVQVQNKTNESQRVSQGFYSSVTYGFGDLQDDTDDSQVVVKPDVMQKDKAERLKLAINDLQIGKRIQTELKQQGRTVTWLAKQLGMERTGLYYTFRQNSVDLELLLRISAFIGHNFLQDVADVFKAYGLLFLNIL